jgi:hypothetical protein
VNIYEDVAECAVEYARQYRNLDSYVDISKAREELFKAVDRYEDFHAGMTDEEGR